MDFRDELSGVLIEDIEDLVAEYTGDQRNNRKYVVPKVKRKKEQRSKEADKYQPPVCDSIIPGTQRIFLKTWGCSHNNSDSEYMAGQLAGFGYILTDDKTEADLWLLNSCTVKNPSEDHFRNDVVEAKKRNKHIVLAGCVPQGQPKSSYLEGLSIVGVQQIDRIVEVVEETLKGYTVRLLGTKKDKGKKVGGAPLSMPKVRKNPLIEIIAINTGCLNQCTYCKTKHARGELGSYNVSDIVDRASEAFAEGVVELWLTSEDLGAYGKDIDTSLPVLLWAVLEVVPPGCRVRLGMTNPPYILEHMEEISKILRHPSVYSFIHIPVQSASDSVLYDMRREYCLEDFEELVNFLKSRVPDITIATDVICGFPTETEKDFQQTLELIERHHFPSLFINQFFPRPATPAAKLPRLDAAEVKGRTKRVSELFNSYTTYDHKVGETQHVLVTDLSSDKRFYVAHNQSYDQVLVPKNGAWMGHLLEVKITATGKHYLECEVIKVEHLNRLPEYPLLHPPKEIDELILSQDTKETPSWRISIADVAKVTSFVLISFFLLKSRFAPKLFQKVFY